MKSIQLDGIKSIDPSFSAAIVTSKTLQQRQMTWCELSDLLCEKISFGTLASIWKEIDAIDASSNTQKKHLLYLNMAILLIQKASEDGTINQNLYFAAKYYIQAAIPLAKKKEDYQARVDCNILLWDIYDILWFLNASQTAYNAALTVADGSHSLEIINYAKWLLSNLEDEDTEEEEEWDMLSHFTAELLWQYGEINLESCGALDGWELLEFLFEKYDWSGDKTLSPIDTVIQKIVGKMKDNKADIYFSIGELCFEVNNERAGYYFQRAITEAEKVNDYSLQLDWFLALAEIARSQWKDGEAFIKKAQDSIKKCPDWQLKLDLLTKISDSIEKL